VSRINVAILGIFLYPVYQRRQNLTDHAIQTHECWQGGIFTSGALESLSSLTGQQMKKRVQADSAPQDCQICFFDAKFHKFDFLRDSWRQKNCLFFSQYFAFFGGSWHMLSDWCLLFLNILPTVLLGFFRQCLVYFLKRYLATHRRIMLSHIWQPIMPKVRVENVEDE